MVIELGFEEKITVGAGVGGGVVVPPGTGGRYGYGAIPAAEREV